MKKKASRLAFQVLESVFFKKAQGKAVDYSQSLPKILQLLRQVNLTSQKVEGKADSSLISKLKTLGRMVRAYKQGEYKQLPWQTFLKIVATLIYFVSPIDFLPDFLPILGFTDDIALIFWVFNSLQREIADFEAWEEGRMITATS
jgi:uncharacterized membrane protein YkvA (DUF1232 family)